MKRKAGFAMGGLGFEGWGGERKDWVGGTGSFAKGVLGLDGRSEGDDAEGGGWG